jgi:hypothetical protein
MKRNVRWTWCLNGLGSELKARSEDGFGRMRACQQNEDV